MGFARNRQQLSYKNLDVGLFWGHKSHEPDALGAAFSNNILALVTHARHCSLLSAVREQQIWLMDKRGPSPVFINLSKLCVTFSVPTGPFTVITDVRGPKG